jgi:lysozyme
MNLRVVFLLVTFTWITTWDSVLAQEEPPEFGRVNSGIQVEELSGNLPAAASSKLKPRAIIQLALDLIKVFEGWSSSVYDDPAGYCTVGYGHLIAKALCSKIDTSRFRSGLTLEQGNQLLADDTRVARVVIQKLVIVDLDRQQFGAITSFVFNVGGENFRKSTLLKLLNAGEYEQAAKELPKWSRADGSVLRGLVLRRNCEASLFRGESLARLDNGKLDVTACGKSIGAAPSFDETIDIVTGEKSP